MATNGLSAKKKKGIEALLTCSTQKAAALKVGVSLRTLSRWLSDREFKAELSRRQDAVVSAVTAALVGRSGEAVKTLDDLLKDSDASPAVKCRAALGILSQTRQAVELSDLAERVAQLEAVNK